MKYCWFKFFLLIRSYICGDKIVKDNIILHYHPTSKSYFGYYKCRKMIFFKIVIFFIFLHIVYDNRFVSARKSPWAVPFGSDISLKSELGYQCLIRQVIDHYGQFQNGRRKIHVFSRNILLSMFFLNFASQAWFECLILHFIVCSSIYKW